MNKITVSVGEIENSCFVIMPFNTNFQVEYDKVIQPAIEELDIKCIRGDEIYTKQRIVDDIWNSIKNCRFVLAELTGKNPNVLYEIGLAHAIGKPVIIITRNSEDVPFDLKAVRYLFYDVNDPFWGETLKIGIQSLIRKVIENPMIENYLDGISNNIKHTKFKPETKKVEIKENQSEEFIGTWQGEFLDSVSSLHKVTLQISKVKNGYSAAAVVSFFTSESETVVQQVMNFNSDGKTLKLNGVNYTYIKMGIENEGYTLDNFILEYNAEKDTLDGRVVSESYGIKMADAIIEFQRI